METTVESDRGALETKIEEVVDVKDDFSDAFDVAEGSEKADLSAADDPNNVVEEVKEEPTKEPPVEPQLEVKPTEQQPGESDEKYEQRYKTLQGIHKHDKNTWESEKAKLLAELEEAKKPKTPDAKKETAAVDAFLDSLTDEQKEQLKEYEQDFDVVSKMEGIKREIELKKLRKEFQDTLNEIKTQLATQNTQISEEIAPALDLVAATDMAVHFSAIQERHDDYEKYRDDGSILQWIEAKPSYIQVAMKKTYEEGAAGDVVDLITDFKRENNIPIVQPSPKVVAIDAKKAEKKQAMTAVTTRRGAVSTGFAVANDFEGAFDEALKK